MDVYMVVLALLGAAFLGAAWVPSLVQDRPLSFPAFYIAVGFVLFSLPLGIYLPNPLERGLFVERFTEVLVIISLAGAGLKLARPVGLQSWKSTWRLLLLAMPLLILGATYLGWTVMGLAPAAALLLGAVLAPTDPVLAADIQVGTPGEEKEGEVRFALTSEAGLNDGLAFPFVYMAIAVAAVPEAGSGWLTDWVLNDLLYKLTVGAVAGVVIGTLLARALFRLPGTAEISGSRDGFVVVALTLLTYGVTELLHGYGFLAVFLAALTIRQSERTHAYHAHLHDFAEGIERLLMTLMLILFGGLIAGGLLAGLSWPMAITALLVVFVLRPLTAMLSLIGLGLPRREQLAIAFFGIRGVGSLYYLAYALNHQAFDGTGALWPTVAFAILASIVVHGGSASYAMKHLDGRVPNRKSSLQ